jgi:hypothetical protein
MTEGVSIEAEVVGDEVDGAEVAVVAEAMSPVVNPIILLAKMSPPTCVFPMKK